MTTRVPAEMLDDYDSSALLSVLPIGTVLPYAGAAVPDADAVATFLFCDGSLLDRADYTVLFARLGTAFNTGGESGTKFRLPDLRGRVPAGRDNMGGTPANRITNAVSGITASTLGASGGDQRLQSHTHAITDPGHAHGGGGSVDIGGGTGSSSKLAGATTETQVTGIEIDTSGTGTGQNLQPLQIVNYIIRAL